MNDRPSPPMRWYDWVFLVAIVMAAVLISCTYHACVGNNWRCGLPGVNCRRLSP
jgi:hypothetical protein